MMDISLKTFVFTLDISENLGNLEIFSDVRGEASGGAVAEGDTQTNGRHKGDRWQDSASLAICCQREFGILPARQRHGSSQRIGFGRHFEQISRKLYS